MSQLILVAYALPYVSLSPDELLLFRLKVIRLNVFRLKICWLIIDGSTQIIHNGSDNNYHFNRLFCRDIRISAVLTPNEVATREAVCDTQGGLKEKTLFYHHEINR